MNQDLLTTLAGILVLGVGSQWLAWRLGVPSILLLLIAGMTVGPLTQLVEPDKLFGSLLLPVVSLSVGLILFEGGLTLKLRELRTVWGSVAGLLTVGVLITWVLGAMAAALILGLPKGTALLLGAILSVTGPTVIGPLLRHIRPTPQATAVAKWEGIVIDPIGATLALLVFEASESLHTADYGQATLSALSGLGLTVAIGAGLGTVAAWLLALCLRRFWIPDELHNPVALMAVIATFTLSNQLHEESGLLAVTVMGVILANQKLVPMQRLIEFKESLTVLLIACLFILLSSRVSLQDVVALGWRGPAFVGAMILIVRPVSVWCSTIGSGLTMAERIFLSWFAPRGIVAAAVASVFAIRLGEGGDPMVPATFLVIFSTVACYGLTAGPLARWLGLSVIHPQNVLIGGANQFARAVAEVLKSAGFRAVLVDDQYERVRQARLMGLEVCHANLLSELVVDKVSFADLGRFLALTSNDEINSLSATRFREFFGRENVYQLPPLHGTRARDEQDLRHLSGRLLFGSELTYDQLDAAIDAKAVMKVTHLSNEFTFEAFTERYGTLAKPLFVMDGKRLIIHSVDRKFAPKPGQAIISLVLPAADRVEP